MFTGRRGGGRHVDPITGRRIETGPGQRNVGTCRCFSAVGAPAIGGARPLCPLSPTGPRPRPGDEGRAGVVNDAHVRTFRLLGNWAYSGSGRTQGLGVLGEWAYTGTERTRGLGVLGDWAHSGIVRTQGLTVLRDWVYSGTGRTDGLGILRDCTCTGTGRVRGLGVLGDWSYSGTGGRNQKD